LGGRSHPFGPATPNGLNDFFFFFIKIWLLGVFEATFNPQLGWSKLLLATLNGVANQPLFLVV
jgi:hypothetical protein